MNRLSAFVARLHPGQLILLVLAGIGAVVWLGYTHAHYTMLERQDVALEAQRGFDSESLSERRREEIDSLENEIAKTRKWLTLFPAAAGRQEARRLAVEDGYTLPNFDTLGMRNQESAVRDFYDHYARQEREWSRDAGLAAQAGRRTRTRVDIALGVLVILTCALLRVWFGEKRSDVGELSRKDHS